MEGSINRDLWREILSSKLPGEKAQFMMAPTFRGVFRNDKDPIRAAVLILLYPSNEKTRLVFIKRNEYDGPHSAQVSLPGGAWEKKDGSMKNTAIRETPLTELLDPRNLDSERMLRHGQSIEAPFYRVGKEKIWGATAMILSEFLQLASILQ